MERDMNQSALPALCRGGCGFYGSPATEGFCSKCFKDTLKRKQDPGRISPTTSTAPKSVDSSSNHERTVSSSAVAAAIENLVAPMQASCSSLAQSKSEDFGVTLPQVSSGLVSLPATSSGSVVDHANVEDEKPAETVPSASTVQKSKNRCDQCRKRVGLTGFQCRCGGLYCAMHRYSDMHHCSFDYKALGEEEVRKNNPVVKSEKIIKL